MPIEKPSALSNFFTKNFSRRNGPYLTEARVEKGFNSDVVFRGLNFHVQSEDWGIDNPYIVSRIYQDGAVIKSIKTAYSEVLRPSASQSRVIAPGRAPSDPQAIRVALREQHEKILDLLLSGQLF